MSIEEMRSVDVRTVQADQLADRRGIVIDQKLPRKGSLGNYGFVVISVSGVWVFFFFFFWLPQNPETYQVFFSFSAGFSRR